MTGIFQKIKHWVGIKNTTHYPYPAVDIMLPNNVSLHLVGSIHMGVPTMTPLSNVLISEIKKADAVIVEADISTDVQPFDQSSLFRDSLETRLNSSLFSQITQHCEDLSLSLYQLDNKPLWQIALILQSTQAMQLGLQPQYGIDYQVIQHANEYERSIIELEGIESQVALLLDFPEDGQQLLEDTLKNWHENARTLQIMINWWLNYNSREKQPPLPNTFSKAVFDILMQSRNQKWVGILSKLPAGRYVVTVGALHLFGEENLIDLLTHQA
ncbi:polysaccharide biosynthesis protein GumN [Proteus sp. G2669]|uniref:TraB/GumN family protein n=1 Tax=Proteus sp. G2669 TaxID=2698881 RepID=UPI001412FBA8|nr:TraB/GumN family protein [Proteus sp. G2669]NBM54513.1 polysaccharide biosynthesis protein GumN [Proteus sp. G2669]